MKRKRGRCSNSRKSSASKRSSPSRRKMRSRYWNPDAVLRVCEGRSKRIGACADVGHWYRSGFMPLDCVKKLDGRIISLHFKDLNAEKKDVVWGTGECDLRAIMIELRRQGGPLVFSIEFESTTGQELIDN